MSINRPTMTDDQIEALRIEAGAAGDSAQVGICDRALDGDDNAVAECARIILIAQAQLDAIVHAKLDAMSGAHKPSPLVHATSKTRTITLTDRSPVTIREDEWPIIAAAKYEHGVNESTGDWNRRSIGSLHVRRHADGRAIVYGRDVYDTRWQGEHSTIYRDGELLAADADVVAAIRRVGQSLIARGAHDRLMAECIIECIADLPAEELR